QRSVEREDRRTVGATTAAEDGTERRVRPDNRLGGECRLRTASASDVHGVAAGGAGSVDGDPPRAGAGRLPPEAAAHQHAVAGTGDAERSVLRRGGAGAGAAHGARGRRNGRGADAVRLPRVPDPTAERAGAESPGRAVSEGARALRRQP